jgi:hypothetical protein
LQKLKNSTAAAQQLKDYLKEISRRVSFGDTVAPLEPATRRFTRRLAGCPEAM